MSEETGKLEERVEILGQMVEEIDDDYSALAKTVSDLGVLEHDVERRIDDAETLRSEVSHYVVEIKMLSEKLEEQIRTANKLLFSFYKILESPTTVKLTSGNIIAVRPATREELKSGAAISVRQATAAEIRGN